MRCLQQLSYLQVSVQLQDEPEDDKSAMPDMSGMGGGMGGMY
jgi:hypothetical protein